jgi:hypothetical protein
MNKSLLVWGTVLLAAACGALVQPTPQSHWDASYDPVSRTRFIPLELILGGDWNGGRALALPAGPFTESIPNIASTWTGPTAWRNGDTGETIMVYERSGRGGVVQKMAVRKAGDAIGRVADSRFGSTCDGEGKYPLGIWKQGETRRYEYSCWYGPAGERRPRVNVTTITIEEIDFTHAGIAHSLRVRWILKRKGEEKELDNRVYVYSPGLGLAHVQ